MLQIVYEQVEGERLRDVVDEYDEQNELRRASISIGRTL